MGLLLKPFPGVAAKAQEPAALVNSPSYGWHAKETGPSLSPRATQNRNLKSPQEALWGRGPP